MAGLMLVALGLARLGGIIRFIPDPVITGFTAGIGVVIFVGQWRYFFGLPAAGAGTSTRCSGRSCRRFAASLADGGARDRALLAIVLVPRSPA